MFKLYRAKTRFLEGPFLGFGRAPTRKRKDWGEREEWMRQERKEEAEQYRIRRCENRVHRLLLL